jgi:hypothetical protein
MANISSHRSASENRADFAADDASASPPGGATRLPDPRYDYALRLAVGALVEESVDSLVHPDGARSPQYEARLVAALGEAAAAGADDVSFRYHAWAIAAEASALLETGLIPTASSPTRRTRGLAYWPAALIDVPFRALGPETGEAAGLPSYDAVLQHLAAHAIVACRLARRSIAVDFSGWKDRQTTPLGRLRVLLAGAEVDAQTGVAVDVRSCECPLLAQLVTYEARGLGDAPLVFPDEWSATVEQRPELKTFIDTQLAVVRPIVAWALETGLVDAVADRLDVSGFTVVRPAEVAAAPRSRGRGQPATT